MTNEPIVNVPLHMFPQQRLLVKCTHANVALVSKVGVSFHVLCQMRHLDKLLVALAALERKHAVRFHMLRQMRLLFKRFVGALRTREAAHSTVHE